jgi:hypothetical protein
MKNDLIYLDNNATTRVAPEVFEAMQPYLSEFFGNPSSAHTLGRTMKQAIEQAREHVASLIGAADASDEVRLLRSRRRNISSRRWWNTKRCVTSVARSSAKVMKLRGSVLTETANSI